MHWHYSLAIRYSDRVTPCTVFVCSNHDGLLLSWEVCWQLQIVPNDYNVMNLIQITLGKPRTVALGYLLAGTHYGRTVRVRLSLYPQSVNCYLFISVCILGHPADHGRSTYARPCAIGRYPDMRSRHSPSAICTL